MAIKPDKNSLAAPRPSGIIANKFSPFIAAVSSLPKMLKFFIWSIVAVFVSFAVYLMAFFSHQGSLNQFCKENSYGVPLETIEKKIKLLNFVNSEVIKGERVDGIWFQPRLTVQSKLSPEDFACEIKLSFSDDESVMFVTGGYTAVEIGSPLGVFGLIIEIVN